MEIKNIKISIDSWIKLRNKLSQEEIIEHIDGLINERIEKNKLGFFGKNSMLAKKVNQYTKQGEFIKTWDCAIDVERELGIDQGNISKVCNGINKSTGGFKWKFFNTK